VLKTELIEEIATTGEQEGEREEILARSFSLLKPRRCLADLFSHPILLVHGPATGGHKRVTARKARSAAGIYVQWCARYAPPAVAGAHYPRSRGFSTRRA
jgi:hypothetical protein